MHLGHDTQSLADFQKNPPEYVQQLKKTGQPLVLTVNGKAELVVQDAASYQKLLDMADEARLLEGIRQGLADVEAGRTITLEEFKQHVEQTHGFSL